LKKRNDFKINVYILDCKLNVYKGKMNTTTWESRIDFVFVNIDGKVKKIGKEKWTRRSAFAAFLTREELEKYKNVFITFCLVREAEEVLGLSGR
jgi:hypothetical protein